MRYVRLRSTILVLSITTMSLFFWYSVGTSKPQDHKQHQTISKPTTAALDGAFNPDVIPDWVAYEIFFNSIGVPEDAPEKQKEIGRKLAERAGLDDEKVNKIKLSHKNLKPKLEDLEHQVNVLKDKTWPNPDSKTMSDLDKLQKQREQTVEETIRALQKDIGNEASERLAEHIRKNIKSKIKFYNSPPIEVFQRK